MAGTKWAHTLEQVGLDADCAVFSFQAVKNLLSADAGMICFKDELLDARARKMSWLGIDKSTYQRYSPSSYVWRYDVTDVGFKYHGNSIMASICLVSLKYLDVDNEHRRMLATQYDELLQGSVHIKTIPYNDDVVPSRHLYQIVVEHRDALLEKLTSQNIFCGVHYIDNSTYPIYSDCKNHAINARYLSDRLLSLPLHLGVSIEDVDNIVNAINH
jgi:dTDP-4-amino-4,6-dideoxygalactose transaminase